MSVSFHRCIGLGAHCHARAHDPNTQKKSLDASRGGQMKSCNDAGCPDARERAGPVFPPPPHMCGGGGNTGIELNSLSFKYKFIQ